MPEIEEYSPKQSCRNYEDAVLFREAPASSGPPESPRKTGNSSRDKDDQVSPDEPGKERGRARFGNKELCSPKRELGEAKMLLVFDRVGAGYGNRAPVT